jgi:flavin-dependent dehydrogenase
VLGAGPAGAIAAHTLARAGARVALIERGMHSTAARIGETIPAEAKLVLDSVGVTDCPSDNAHLRSNGNIARWGSESAHSQASILSCYGSGWHLDRGQFNKELLRAARIAGTRIFDALFRSAQWMPRNGWLLEAERHKIVAQHVIDCSGRPARFATQVGTPRHVHDKLVALWAILQSPDEGDSDEGDLNTYVEAAPNGWWYSTRIPKRRRVIAYFTDGDLLDRPTCTQPGFLEFFCRSKHLGDTAQRLRFISKPLRSAAMSTRLIRAVGRNWIAAGDAAQSFDPLSSCGITEALIGGSNAAATVISLQGGGTYTLNDYQERLDACFSSYLADRNLFYGIEQRWPDNPFWRRRHGLAA